MEYAENAVQGITLSVDAVMTETKKLIIHFLIKILYYDTHHKN